MPKAPERSGMALLSVSAAALLPKASCRPTPRRLRRSDPLLILGWN